MATPASPLDIAFLHPDLGLGGAERLVVDACLELQARGHRVTLYTAHHDPRRSFPETNDGRIAIHVGGSWIPPALFNRWRVICSILRMAAALREMKRRGHAPDLIFCDLVPHVIPWIRRRTRARVLYYCHYPDRLLTPHRRFPYRLYRLPFDELERAGTARADAILVNSLFTARTFLETFADRVPRPRVLYPGVDLAEFSGPTIRKASSPLRLLSLNRFDPGKNLELAIECLACVKQSRPGAEFHLVMAGGFDPRIAGQGEYLARLRALTRERGVDDIVDFRLSVSHEERRQLMMAAHCLLFTAPAEHFGIGIVEGMAAGLPVVAVARGGPLEIIVDGVTGFLRENTPEAFTAAVLELAASPERRMEMGQRGRERAGRFSRQHFGDRLAGLVETLVPEATPRFTRGCTP